MNRRNLRSGSWELYHSLILKIKFDLFVVLQTDKVETIVFSLIFTLAL